MMQIKLISGDGEVVVVEKHAACQSNLIKELIGDLGDDTMVEHDIPVANVDGQILSKIAEWCMQHRNDQFTTTDAMKLTTWDKEFFQVDQATLFELIRAADYLDIKLLLHMGCKTVADLIKGKSVPQLREMFDIPENVNDMEEEA